jgi:hypothetical protein
MLSVMFWLVKNLFRAPTVPYALAIIAAMYEESHMQIFTFEPRYMTILVKWKFTFLFVSICVRAGIGL